jgi:hypothetical protein
VLLIVFIVAVSIGNTPFYFLLAKLLVDNHSEHNNIVFERPDLQLWLDSIYGMHDKLRTHLSKEIEKSFSSARRINSGTRWTQVLALL